MFFFFQASFAESIKIKLPNVIQTATNNIQHPLTHKKVKKKLQEEKRNKT